MESEDFLIPKKLSAQLAEKAESSLIMEEIHLSGQIPAGASYYLANIPEADQKVIKDASQNCFVIPERINAQLSEKAESSIEVKNHLLSGQFPAGASYYLCNINEAESKLIKEASENFIEKVGDSKICTLSRNLVQLPGLKIIGKTGHFGQGEQQ